MLQVIACIESTIPFRTQNDKNKNSFILLKQRLIEIADQSELNISEEEVNDSIKKCIGIANQDICSFFSDDLGDYIAMK